MNPESWFGYEFVLVHQKTDLVITISDVIISLSVKDIDFKNAFEDYRYIEDVEVPIERFSMYKKIENSQLQWCSLDI